MMVGIYLQSKEKYDTQQELLEIIPHNVLLY